MIVDQVHVARAHMDIILAQIAVIGNDPMLFYKISLLSRLSNKFLLQRDIHQIQQPFVKPYTLSRVRQLVNLSIKNILVNGEFEYTVFVLNKKLIHRFEPSILSSRCLPAIVSINHIIYCLYGMIHRDEICENGNVLPANVYKGNTYNHFQWYNYGKKHRTCRDSRGQLLPAEVYDDETKTTFQWFVGGRIVTYNDMTTVTIDKKTETITCYNSFTRHKETFTRDDESYEKYNIQLV